MKPPRSWRAREIPVANYAAPDPRRVKALVAATVLLALAGAVAVFALATELG